MNMNNLEFNQKLFEFIENATCAFTGIKEIKKMLLNNNFIELEENEEWHLELNQNYFITRNDSSLIAFTTGSNNSFNITWNANYN